MRRNLAILAGFAVAAFGAVILGEYRFGGFTAFASALILGLFASEAVVSVARTGGRVEASASALAAAGGLVWAAWISWGHRLDLMPVQGWAAVVFGAAVGGLRAWWPARAARSRLAPPRTDAGAT